MSVTLHRRRATPPAGPAPLQEAELERVTAALQALAQAVVRVASRRAAGPHTTIRGLLSLQYGISDRDVAAIGELLEGRLP